MSELALVVVPLFSVSELALVVLYHIFSVGTGSDTVVVVVYHIFSVIVNVHYFSIFGVLVASGERKHKLCWPLFIVIVYCLKQKSTLK